MAIFQVNSWLFSGANRGYFLGQIVAILAVPEPKRYKNALGFSLVFTELLPLSLH